MPDPTLLNSQEIGTLGFFLSLISLLGTFFYVQLSNWLRELIASEAIYDANMVGGTEQEKEELRKLKYGIAGLYNRVPQITSAAISVFITLIAGIIMSILGHALETDHLAQKLTLALFAFLLIYYGLTIYLLVRGYAIGRKIYLGTRPKPKAKA